MTAKRISRFERLKLDDSLVAHIIWAGGTAEDCACALALANKQLMERILKLEMIAPRKYKMPDGRIMIWRCPEKLVPEIQDMGPVGKQPKEKHDAKTDTRRG